MTAWAFLQPNRENSSPSKKLSGRLKIIPLLKFAAPRAIVPLIGSPCCRPFYIDERRPLASGISSVRHGALGLLGWRRNRKNINARLILGAEPGGR